MLKEDTPLDNKIPSFAFCGIKRIEIPYKDEDFNTENKGRNIIEKYLLRILKTHNDNACKEKYLWEYKKGVQDILNKTRLYNKDSSNNNIVVENHAYKQVNFKVGFLTSTPRDYTQKEDVETDDIKYLKRYFTDTAFFSKDKEMREWAYTVGVGIDSIEPRTDIIKDDGNGNYSFMTKEDGFDIDYEAPFIYNSLSPLENFVVYSSGKDKEPLFCVSIIEKDIGDKKTINLKKEIFIETRYAYFKAISSYNYGNIDKIEDNGVKALHYLPFVEHSFNIDRLGIVEINASLFNSINVLRSSVADMTVDNANAILVFKNTDIDSDQVSEMKKAGAIIIANPKDGTNAQAGLDTIRVEIPFDGLENYYESLLSQCYGIVSVPLANQQSTSGGDTGQARQLGGGWEDAFQTTNNEKTTFLKSDYEILKKILFICRQVQNCPLNDIHTSEIDIKYNISQNSNLLVKAQSINQLWQVKFPKKYIVQASGLFNDIDTVAKEWEKTEKEAEQQNNNSQE